MATADFTTLVATKFIKIKVEPKAFASTTSDFSAPSDVSTPGEAKDWPISASYLAATTSAAVALALTTLY